MGVPILHQLDPPLGAMLQITGTFAAVNNGGAYSEAELDIDERWKLCDGSLVSDADSPFNTRYVPELSDGRFIRGDSTPGGVGGQATLNPFTDFQAAGNYTPAASIQDHSHAPNTYAGGSHVHTAGYTTSGHVHNMNHDHTVAVGNPDTLQNMGINNPVRSIPSNTHTHPLDVAAHSGNTAGASSNGTTGNTDASNSTLTGNTDLATPSWTGNAVARNTWFLDSDVNIEPSYLTCKFYMRIKPGSVRNQYRVPLGSVIAIMGTFTAVDNGGTYSEVQVPNIQDAWKACDGSVISDSESPMNGRYVPRINNDMYMRGASGDSVEGGSNTKNPSSQFAAAGNYTVGGSVDSHQHGSTTLVHPSHSHANTGNGLTRVNHFHGLGGHTHSGTPGLYSGLRTIDGDEQVTPISRDIHTHPAFTSGGPSVNSGSTQPVITGTSAAATPSITGNTQSTTPSFSGGVTARSAWFESSSLNMEPKYISSIHYMRIK